MLTFSHCSQAMQGHSQLRDLKMEAHNPLPLCDVGKVRVKQENRECFMLTDNIHLHLVLRTKHYRSICGTSKTDYHNPNVRASACLTFPLTHTHTHTHPPSGARPAPCYNPLCPMLDYPLNIYILQIQQAASDRGHL